MSCIEEMKKICQAQKEKFINAKEEGVEFEFNIQPIEIIRQ